MTLNVLAIADEVHPLLYDYFDAERWRDIDLILSAGDIPPGCLDYLCTTLNVPLFYVRGNHDGHYPSSLYDGAENLHGRIVTFRGVRFAGFEGSRRYNRGRVQYTEHEMSVLARRMQLRSLRAGPPNVVLTHAPPAGCHDAEQGCHRGFDTFRRLIDSWSPVYFVHGHTHSHYSRTAISSIGQTTVVNAFPYRVIQIANAHTTHTHRTGIHVGFKRLLAPHVDA